MKKSFGFPTRLLQRFPLKNCVRFSNFSGPSVPYIKPSSPWLSSTQANDALSLWSSLDTRENKAEGLFTSMDHDQRPTDYKKLGGSCAFLLGQQPRLAGEYSLNLLWKEKCLTRYSCLLNRMVSSVVTSDASHLDHRKEISASSLFCFDTMWLWH